MYLFFFSFIVILPIVASLLYKHQGKRQILHFDSVQFVYLFIFLPILYVWIKSFLFYILLNEVSVSLSKSTVFIIDTIFSILAFYLFAVSSIHSLTKTFRLQKHYDPEIDVFHLSEYFHLWWTHITVNLGIMVIASFLSTVNIFIPMGLQENRLSLLLCTSLGGVLGIGMFFLIWIQDPLQEKRRFLRLMKIILMLFFVYHVIVYFWFAPKFSLNFLIYWFIFFLFLSSSIAIFILPKNKVAQKMRQKLLSPDWGNNIQI